MVSYRLSMATEYLFVNFVFAIHIIVVMVFIRRESTGSKALGNGGGGNRERWKLVIGFVSGRGWRHGVKVVIFIYCL